MPASDECGALAGALRTLKAAHSSSGGGNAPDAHARLRAYGTISAVFASRDRRRTLRRSREAKTALMVP